MDEEERKLDRRLRDKFLEGRYNFWSGIITVDGILISGISILSLINEQITILFIIFILAALLLGITSLFLILNIQRNFKEFYYKIGRENYVLLQKAKEVEKDASKLKEEIDTKEEWAYLLLKYQVGVIFFTVFIGIIFR